MNEKRSALVFGATGLVGRYLVEELIDNQEYSLIKVFGRGEYQAKNEKIEYHRIDFDQPGSWSGRVTGDDLFVCLGTTIRKAGSVAMMERIDRDYPASIARIGAENGIRRVAVVSSMGANPASKNYYLRIKGQMEERIMAAGIAKKVIVRPSMLMGDRVEFRFSEWLAKGVMTVINPLLAGSARKYRGIHGRTVARAMIGLLKFPSDQVVFQSDRLLDEGR
ncbi:MAG: hypothetical protein A2X22_02445 [Bacteroidetes bacterium GWF2_49_14]|nr:MAG: hypothetical protein A2X22_02445 [Bacteroidetes bacterium GWF2_49_14]